MAELTFEQELFLKDYVDSRVKAGDPHAEQLLKIVEQVNKNGYFERVKEDVLLIAEECDYQISDDVLENIIYTTMKYDDSDYYDYIRELISQSLQNEELAYV